MKIDTEQLAEFLQQLVEQAARAGAEQALAIANIEDRMLTVEEASELTQISKQTLYQMIEDGELEAHHFGRSKRLRWSQICAATKRFPNPQSGRVN